MAEPIKRGPGRPPGAKSAAKPAATQSPARPAEKPPAARQEPCAQCFPGGWDSLGADAYSAGCEHGNYRKEA
jgi:hypothetical protein